MKLQHVPIGLLHRGRYQPRHEPQSADIEELAKSIEATRGAVQPITVVPRSVTPDTDGYEIVAGERRYWAYRHLGAPTVPCVVRDDIGDEDMAIMALNENIGRKDLSALEISQALQLIKSRFRITNQELAERVGTTRDQISRLLGIQRLPRAVQKLIAEGNLTLGAAKCLMTRRIDVAQKIDLAQQAVAENWSVRDLEIRIKRLLIDSADRDLEALKKTIETSLGALCDFRLSDGRYMLRIETYTPEILSGVLEKLVELLDSAGDAPIEPVTLEIKGKTEAFEFLRAMEWDG